MINIGVKIDDQATPYLAQVRHAVGKPQGLHKRMAGRVEILVRDYIRTNGDNVHTTARRLGATPTLHYIRAAQTVKGRSVDTGAEITLRGAIFQRTDRAVRVTARAAKYLTIPAHRAAYGRRAREIGGLRYARFRNGTMALVRDIPGVGGAKPTTTVYYWLKKTVLLPQDRTLLPDDQAFAQAMDEGAKDYIVDYAEAREAGRDPNLI